MRLLRLGLGMLLLLLATTVAASAATISVRADSWPPYNDTPQEVKAGYMIEVLKEIFLPLGHKIDYRLLSWDESLAAVRKGQFDAVVGASKDDAPDFVYPKETFGRSGNGFFVLRGNPWRFQGLSSLTQVRLGVIESYAYNPELDNYLKAHKGTTRIVVAGGETPLGDLIDLLRQGKLDVIVEDTSVMTYALAKSKVPPGEIKRAGELGESSDLYVAFSPGGKNSREYARLFDAGLIKLRQSGRLQAILARYGLKDWKEQ